MTQSTKRSTTQTTLKSAGRSGLFLALLVFGFSSGAATLNFHADQRVNVRVGENGAVFVNRQRYFVRGSKMMITQRPSSDFCELVVFGYSYGQTLQDAEFEILEVQEDRLSDPNLGTTWQVFLKDPEFLSPAYLDCQGRSFSGGGDFCDRINRFSPALLTCRNASPF